MPRKTKYRQEYCSQVVKLMQEGHSIASTAKTIGVSVSTLRNWEKDTRFPDFQNAMQYARDYYLAYWEDLGLKIAKGELKANPTAWIYNMKCRFGGDWNENARAIDALVNSNNEQQIDEQLLVLMKGLYKNDKKLKPKTPKEQIAENNRLHNSQTSDDSDNKFR